ncbi:glycosyltransferase [Vibrio fortis]|uniref:glycosyltransferase n=1 Tax=Vibrio fortis TaxID=212667 RepID=UPI0036F430A8
MKAQGKKIIHVVQHLAPGGLETLTLDLLRLADPKDQVLIVSLEGQRDSSINNWPKLEQYRSQIVFLDKKPGVQFNVLLSLIKAFSSIKPDVVHTHHIGPLLYAGYAARLCSVPYRIHTEHDAWHLKNAKRRRLQAIALQFAKPMLVADAAKVYNQLCSAFSYKNITTIRNGIDCEKFHPTSKIASRRLFNLSEDDFIVGCAGRLEEVKGQDQLIKALPLIPKRIKVAIAGDGSQREALELLAKKLNVSDRVTFLGLVEDMVSFYNSLDVFCLPSRSEGLPLSSLEAQACNIPTVAMDVGAVKETLCPVTGHLVKPDNIPHLAYSLFKTSQNDTLENFSNPRRYVLENFNISDMVDSYNKLSEESYV